MNQQELLVKNKKGIQRTDLKKIYAKNKKCVDFLYVKIKIRRKKIEEDGKQNASFFIDTYSTEILVLCIGKSLNNDFIEITQIY